MQSIAISLILGNILILSPYYELLPLVFVPLSIGFVANIRIFYESKSRGTRKIGEAHFFYTIVSSLIFSSLFLVALLNKSELHPDFYFYHLITNQLSTGMGTTSIINFPSKSFYYYGSSVLPTALQLLFMKIDPFFFTALAYASYLFFYLFTLSKLIASLFSFNLKKHFIVFISTLSLSSNTFIGNSASILDGKTFPLFSFELQSQNLLLAYGLVFLGTSKLIDEQQCKTSLFFYLFLSFSAICITKFTLVPFALIFSLVLYLFLNKRESVSIVSRKVIVLISTAILSFNISYFSYFRSANTKFSDFQFDELTLDLKDFLKSPFLMVLVLSFCFFWFDKSMIRKYTFSTTLILVLCDFFVSRLQLSSQLAIFSQFRGTVLLIVWFLIIKDIKLYSERSLCFIPLFAVIDVVYDFAYSMFYFTNGIFSRLALEFILFFLLIFLVSWKQDSKLFVVPISFISFIISPVALISGLLQYSSSTGHNYNISPETRLSLYELKEKISDIEMTQDYLGVSNVLCISNFGVVLSSTQCDNRSPLSSGFLGLPAFGEFSEYTGPEGSRENRQARARLNALLSCYNIDCSQFLLLQAKSVGKKGFIYIEDVKLPPLKIQGDPLLTHGRYKVTKVRELDN